MFGITILNEMIPIVIGIFMIISFFTHLKKVKRLINKGVEVEGIVFDIV
jgi:hypothetical protein